ncbi:hypothetical protein PHLGIDRAFT_95749 [Phlebiopsis gigantea 11061_1 CR5-6]|uniref:DAGKc domain-containing protein n=1 Tax=Phlebiopsis gigantea (strain 11061_1 CR5-6) TaxID=745531 RepID=A0A0C3S3W2_PHLG1|nr:hypothetical protein PHLGIDRAFT_95749 [Phlebiopsis gigantea 11061_1 CR5-6]
MSLLVLYNPVCGHSQGHAIFQHIVLPRLAQHGHTPAAVVATTHPGHAGEVVLQHLAAADGPLTVVLGSGDGTLHEILAALHSGAPTGTRTAARLLSFVLVPCGTANALYHSLFPPSPDSSQELRDSQTRSLDAYLTDGPRARPLTLAQTVLLDGAQQPTGASIAAVVASTALHASILHDSEALRPTHPGVERFKLAAQQNLTRWYHARARLAVAHTPVPNAGIAPVVEIFSPAARGFVPYTGPGAAPDGTAVTLDGPFVYFLSTVNADRLEANFRIAPCQSTFPPLPESSPPTIDVVVIRPLRDPALLEESEHARQAFAEKSMAILTAAYRDGAHIHARYGGAGEVVEGGTGDVVVEYFRCNSWEWIPDPSDQYAHLVCVDGEILQVEPGGKAVNTALHRADGYTISVYS